MLDDVLGGRDWPEREWLSIEEVVQALGALTTNDRFTISLRHHGGGGIAVAADVHVGEGYLSNGELRALLDRFESAGFFPFLSSGQSDEGVIRIGIGSKRWQAGAWHVSTLSGMK